MLEWRILWATIPDFYRFAPRPPGPGALPVFAFVSDCSNFGLSTVNYQLTGNCRIMNTCRNCARNSSRMSTCDLNDLKYLKNEHIQKTIPGVGIRLDSNLKLRLSSRHLNRSIE